MKIHFVCTGNICRSPLAAALFEELAPRRDLSEVEAESSGLFAIVGGLAAAAIRQLGALRGLSLEDHRGQAFDAGRVGSTDLVVVMERVHRSLILDNTELGPEQVLLLGEFDPGGPPDVEDPYGGSQADYEECARRLERCVRGLIDWLARGGA